MLHRLLFCHPGRPGPHCHPRILAGAPVIPANAGTPLPTANLGRCTCHPREGRDPSTLN
ncbi:MAG: hypothetical protein NTV01_00155 [Bacteroidia bacterium]|nr:hypothetical protein [Bacteroidia bacterium]